MELFFVAVLANFGTTTNILLVSLERRAVISAALMQTNFTVADKEIQRFAYSICQPHNL
jgi:hypothetical protein